MAPTPVSHADPEQARLAALRRYAILDTPPERPFEELVQQTARELGYPTAMLGFMDSDRCWFKATTGMQAQDAHVREIPRHLALCNHALTSSGVLVVRDAREDARFAQLPIVDRPRGYRAYVAAQLITPDGFTIGTLCALDDEPREPTAEQRVRLRWLAERAIQLVEQRRREFGPAASIALAPPEAAHPEGSSELVLVVDDEDLIRAMMAAMMTRLGHGVRVAENGRAALECLAAEGGRVRLVITDIHMPVMNGLELVEALRRQPNPPAVVVMSGKFTDPIRAQLRAAGVTAMFGKPFTMADVTRAMDLARAAAR